MLAVARKPKTPALKSRTLPTTNGLPTKSQILSFIQDAQEAVGKREISRAFNVKGDNRVLLKHLLAEMAEEGSLAGNRKSFKEKGRLAPVAVFEVMARDKQGDLVAEPVVWDLDDGPKPRVLVRGSRINGHAVAFKREISFGIGDRVLARTIRLERGDAFDYAIEPIKRLPKEKSGALGIFRTRKGGGGTIEPVDKKELRSWSIGPDQIGDAKDGDLVRFDLSRSGRGGIPNARVVDVLGNPNDQRQISLIAVHAHGIPDEFPTRVLDELDALHTPTMHGRLDLRDVPLITIDPADARDHDDAVHAEADTDPNNAGGWIVIVAIADVAQYVRSGSALDREAQLRGNSVYFPDRVVPMLPEKISNDLCSLRELEERPCLAVHMVFDKSGSKRRHTFHRAMMRSAAKLSYQEAQAAIDGNPGAKAAPLLESVLRPLWAAYAALCIARDARGPLDLDLPERKIVLNADGHVDRVIVPERLAAHRLIEECMIQANVAAAETLEEKHVGCIFRIHDQPSREKLTGLREFLATLEMQVPPAGTLKPSHINQILAEAKGQPSADLVNEVVLRSQAQAIYSPENIGHFGLHLRRYAHFTSPIRRYADLMVHRALVKALGIGAGGITDAELDRLAEISDVISGTERRAMAAERETTDRLIAAFLADRVGAEFEGRIGGVTRSGLFIKLKDTGADGFIPISTLGTEYFTHNETARALVGERTGVTYRLGDSVSVRLLEALPMAGALRFEMLSEGSQGSAKGTVSRVGGRPKGGFVPRRPGGRR
jgi:ribonuclease R